MHLTPQVRVEGTEVKFGRGLVAQKLKKRRPALLGELDLFPARLDDVRLHRLG